MTEQLLWSIARDRHGVVSLAIAESNGISRATMCRQVRRCRAIRVHRATYYFGSGPIPDKARCRAALDAFGPEAVISGWMAAWLWGLIPDAPRVIELLVPTHRRSRDGVIARQSPTLVDMAIHEIDGLRVVGVEQLLMELAGRTSSGRLARVIHEAGFRRVLCLRRLRAVVDASVGRRGIRSLGLALEMHEDGSTGNRSRFEEATSDRVIDVPGVARLVCTRTSVAGLTLEPDLHYESLDLMVEIDDWSHDRPTTRRQDEANDRRLAAVGITVVRIRWDAVDEGVRTANREIVTRCLARGLPVPRRILKYAARS